MINEEHKAHHATYLITTRLQMETHERHKKWFNNGLHINLVKYPHWTIKELWYNKRFLNSWVDEREGRAIVFAVCNLLEVLDEPGL